MGSSYIVNRLCHINGNGQHWIEGERYHACVLVRNTPPRVAEEVPEDGKEYLVLIAKYLYYARSAETTQVTVLFRRDRVVERQGFNYSTVFEMFADVPWKIPEVLMPPSGQWVSECHRNALLQFPNARVLYFHLYIIGPYRPGGDDYIEAEFVEPEYDSYMKAQLKPVNVVREDHMCAICLERFVDCPEDVVHTHCSHHFHRHCLETWLLSRNSCPSCRRVVVQ